MPLWLTLAFTSVAGAYHFHRFGKRDIAIATVLYSVLIYCIVYFVSFDENLGLGLGLLGVLSLIRLRSTTSNLLDVGFVFYAITLGLLNASIDLGYQFTAGLNVFLTLLVCVLASPRVFPKNTRKMQIVLDDLDFVSFSDTASIKKRIKKDFDLDPLTVKVLKINRLKDALTVEISYEFRDRS